MKAIRLHARGGPERLAYEDAPLPEPGAGEALIRVYAAGITPTELSWTDTYQTSDGHARLPTIPVALISQAAGFAALLVAPPGPPSSSGDWRFVAPAPGDAFDYPPLRAIALSREKPDDVPEKVTYRGHRRRSHASRCGERAEPAPCGTARVGRCRPRLQQISAGQDL